MWKCSKINEHMNVQQNHLNIWKCTKYVSSSQKNHLNIRHCTKISRKYTSSSLYKNSFSLYKTLSEIYIFSVQSQLGVWGVRWAWLRDLTQYQTAEKWVGEGISNSLYQAHPKWLITKLDKEPGCKTIWFHVNFITHFLRGATLNVCFTFSLLSYKMGKAFREPYLSCFLP